MAAIVHLLCCWRDTIGGGHGLVGVPLRAEGKRCGIGIAQLRSLSQHQVENRGFIVTRLGNDLEDFAGGAFAFKLRLHFAELADVFDGNDCLRGKGFDQRNFIVRVGTDFFAKQDQCSDAAFAGHQRHKQVRTDAGIVHHTHEMRNTRPVAVRVGHVRDVHRLARDDGERSVRDVRVHADLTLVINLLSVRIDLEGCDKGLVAVTLATHCQCGRVGLTKGGCLFEDQVKNRALIVARGADQLQNLRHSALTLEPGLDLTELAHVFNGDHCLRGKRFNQRNLIICKGLHLTPVKRNVPDRLTLPHQRNGQKCAQAFGLHDFSTHGLAVAVAGCVLEVMAMRDDAVPHRQLGIAIICVVKLQRPDGLTDFQHPQLFTPMGDKTGLLAVLINDVDAAHRGTRQGCRPAQHRLKHGLHIILVLTDDIQDFARCRLALQPRLHFAELAHILNGDHGLLSKAFDQSNLAVIKCRYQRTKQCNCTNSLPVQNQRYEQNRTDADVVDHRTHRAGSGFIQLPFRHIGQMDQLAFQNALGRVGLSGVQWQLAFGKQARRAFADTTSPAGC